MVREQLLCLLSLFCLSLGVDMRGVPLDKQNNYQTSLQFFTCHDGIQKIPTAMVNDDYCDCKDGSDEPGTAACTGGSFFCLNKGHVGKTLYSSRVNDGVCDCCDGSDEWQSGGKDCPNTCSKEAQASKAILNALLEKLEVGTQMRATFVADAKAALNLAASQKQQAEQQKARAESELAQAQELKKQTSLKEEEIKQEKKRKHHDAIHQQLGLSELGEDELRALAVKLIRDGHGEPLMAAVNEVRKAHQPTALPEVDPTHQLMEDAKRARDERGAMRAAEEAAAARNAGSTEQQSADQTAPAPTDSANAAEAQPEKGMQEPPAPPQDVEEDPLPTVSELLTKLVGEEQADQFVLPEAEEARNKVVEHEKAKGSLERKVADLSKDLDTAYGEEGEFYFMKGQCYSMKSGSYTYEMCPFGSAKQDSTSLGSWDRYEFSQDGDTATFYFKGGTKCWNGPQRSLKAHLTCGPKAGEVKRIEETETCVYEMQVSTAAMCNRAHFEKLKKVATEGGDITTIAGVESETAHDEL